MIYEQKNTFLPPPLNEKKKTQKKWQSDKLLNKGKNTPGPNIINNILGCKGKGLESTREVAWGLVGVDSQGMVHSGDRKMELEMCTRKAGMLAKSITSNFELQWKIPQDQEESFNSILKYHPCPSSSQLPGETLLRFRD